LALGRAEAAEVDLRRASILHERSGQSPVEAAETGWLLAQALDALDRRADAVERAELVIRSFDALGPSWEGRAEEVRRWRASRVGPVTDSERSSP
ncbi:MAG: hypothetical protein K0V04_21475, partial [Deltaproteobacteria bacterium]|nr:hypothetical protein [Deltaproteobacteria bacterium]